MCSRGMFVHCPRCLGAEVAVLGAELLCGDGISAKWALEHAKALHHCDGVMPHSFKYRRLFQYDSELKLPPPFVTNESRCESGPSALTLWRLDSVLTAAGHLPPQNTTCEGRKEENTASKDRARCSTSTT
jgi:hypothetical protein